VASDWREVIAGGSEVLGHGWQPLLEPCDDAVERGGNLLGIRLVEDSAHRGVTHA
jgi:hypothetical protein